MTELVLRSLVVSLAATGLAAAIALPVALWLGIARFRGRKVILLALNIYMAVPSVFVGLVLYGLLSRQGPLGFLEWLYTPQALVIGQFFLALPLILAVLVAALQRADPRVYPTAVSLGATRWRAALLVLAEHRGAVGIALAAGLGRALTEVGCALIVGGNIRGQTRILTTAIALETSKGEFAAALSMGVVLLLLALGLNVLIHRASAD